MTSPPTPDRPARSPGTRLAFTTVVERHGADLHRYAWSLTRSPDDADDVYQETLLKAYRAWRTLPEDANHRAWLFRIASNTWISDRRKNGRVHQMNEATSRMLTSEPDTATQVATSETLEHVTRAIEALPPKQRAAIVLRKYHDMSYDEIGEILECSGEAARANVYEALRKLRGQFAAALAS